MINKEIDSQLYKRDPVLFSDMISMDKTLTSDLKTESKLFHRECLHN